MPERKHPGPTFVWFKWKNTSFTQTTKAHMHTHIHTNTAILSSMIRWLKHFEQVNTSLKTLPCKWELTIFTKCISLMLLFSKNFKSFKNKFQNLPSLFVPKILCKHFVLLFTVVCYSAGCFPLIQCLPQFVPYLTNRFFVPLIFLCQWRASTQPLHCIPCFHCLSILFCMLMYPL